MACESSDDIIIDLVRRHLRQLQPDTKVPSSARQSHNRICTVIQACQVIRKCLDRRRISVEAFRPPTLAQFEARL